MKKAIVTVLMGNYDHLKPAPKFKGWDRILFTDQKFNNHKGWRVVETPSTGNQKKDSRVFKWLTHKSLPDHDMICYIDASMTLKIEPRECMWFKHPVRTTVSQEARRIIELNKAESDKVREQWLYYLDEGFRDDQGLYQNGFFVRMHDKDTNKLCEKIYSIVNKYTYRDQLAMPFALFKTGYKMQNLKTGMESYNYIKITPHL